MIEFPKDNFLPIEPPFCWQAEVAKVLSLGNNCLIGIESSPLFERVALSDGSNWKSFTPARLSEEDKLISIWLNKFLGKESFLVSFKKAESLEDVQYVITENAIYRV